MLSKKLQTDLYQLYCYESKFRQENVHMEQGRRPINKRWSTLNNINNIVQIDKETIATSNTVSFEVRFWNIKTNNQVFTLIQNHGWVRRIYYCQKACKLFLLLSPNFMFIYKKTSGVIEFTLHQQIMLNSRCEFLISANKMHYVGENSEVGVLNLKNKKRLSLNFLNKPALSLEKWKNYILVGSDFDISFCNKINMQCEHTIKQAHTSSVHIIKILKETKFDQDILFSASYDRSCKLWNPHTLELIKVLDFSADHVQMINQNQMLVHPLLQHPYKYDKTSQCILLFDVNNNYNTHLLPFSEMKCITSFYYIDDQKIFVLGFKSNVFEVYQGLSKKQNNKKRLNSLLKIENKRQ